MPSTPVASPTLRRAPLDPQALSRRLEGADPREIIGCALDVVGPEVVLLSSFADVVLLDLTMAVAPDVPVIFLDTGFHFAETLETARRAQARYGLDLRVVRPELDATDLWVSGTDGCCAARKVRPLDEALAGRPGWLSGLRRSDHPGRAATPVVERDRRGLLKFNPIAAWDDDDVADYATDRGLIVHPLSASGYESSGCWPCTEPGEGRSGRWGGEHRSECGIHA